MPFDLRIPLSLLLLRSDHEVDLVFAALAAGLSKATKAAYKGKDVADLASLVPVSVWLASAIASTFGTSSAIVDNLYAIPGTFPNVIARQVSMGALAGIDPIVTSTERILREQLVNASVDIRISRFTLTENVPLSFRPSQLPPLADLPSSRTWIDPSGKRLSDRIWQIGEDARQQLETVMRFEIQQGTSPSDLASKLSKFLSPDGTELRKGDPGGTTGNFAAKRLARTEVARAHGSGIVAASKADPFTLGVKWNLGFMHSDADDCDTNAYADNYSLGVGVYPIGSVPSYPNHPNCLCFLSPTQTPHISRTLGQIADGSLGFPGFNEQELTEQLSGFMLERIV